MSTRYQIAYIFTKLLQGSQFYKLSSLLMSWTKGTGRSPHVTWFIYEQYPQYITGEWEIYDGPYVVRKSTLDMNQSMLLQYYLAEPLIRNQGLQKTRERLITFLLHRYHSTSWSNKPSEILYSSTPNFSHCASHAQHTPLPTTDGRESNHMYVPRLGLWRKKQSIWRRGRSFQFLTNEIRRKNQVFVP